MNLKRLAAFLFYILRYRFHWIVIKVINIFVWSFLEVSWKIFHGSMKKDWTAVYAC